MLILIGSAQCGYLLNSNFHILLSQSSFAFELIGNATLKHNFRLLNKPSQKPLEIITNPKLTSWHNLKKLSNEISNTANQEHV